MESVLTSLKSLDLKNSTIEDVREHLNQLPIPYTTVPIKEGVYILRARRGKGFTKRKDMTYRPASECTDYQRASLPFETVFYGVISDDQSKQEYARAIVAAECSHFVHYDMNLSGRETMCVSYWEVTKPLNIASFITTSTFADIKGNKILSQFRNIYAKKFGITDNPVITEIAEFIGSEFSKENISHNSLEYLITACLASEIMKIPGIDGIVYPSVPCRGQGGLNIALTPETVDSKLLFKRIVEQTTYRHAGTSIVRIERYTEKGVTKERLLVTDKQIENKLNIKDINALKQIP